MQYLKIVVSGDGGVGKTTFLNTLIKGNYSDSTSLTIGVGLYVKDIIFNEKEYSLQIWDLGGQDRFKSLHEKCRAYIDGCRGGIIMFDLTRIATLENVNYWATIFREENKDIPILFIGAKSDLQESIHITKDHINQIKNELEFFEYLEISSKMGYNINNVFDIIIKEIFK